MLKTWTIWLAESWNSYMSYWRDIFKNFIQNFHSNFSFKFFIQNFHSLHQRLFRINCFQNLEGDLCHSDRPHWLVTGKISAKTAKIRTRGRQKSFPSKIFQNLFLYSDDFSFIKAFFGNRTFSSTSIGLVPSSVTL